MTEQPDVEGQKLFHTFKFAEERRTLYLNAHGKDLAGRHRGFVMYGMEVVKASSKVVEIRPGAVLTPYGTTFFFDAPTGGTAGTDYRRVDLSALTPDPFTEQASYPLVITVYLNWLIPDMRQTPEVQDLSDFGSGNFRFAARVTSYSRDTVSPSLDIPARDPVLMNTLQTPASEYPIESNFDRAAVRAPSGGDSRSGSLKYFEIPLAEIIIGNDPSTGAPATSLDDDTAVSIRQVGNLFSMIGDFVGQDVFFPRNSQQIAGNLANPAGTALGQVAAQRSFGSGNLEADVQAPKYGTGIPLGDQISPVSTSANRYRGDADKASWSGADWSLYRQPSVFRDGDPLLWSFRRLDVMLRQWVNRFGAQDLVSVIQDGVQPSPDATFSIQSITAASDTIAVVSGPLDGSWIGQTITITGNTDGSDSNDGSYTIASVDVGTNSLVTNEDLQYDTGQSGTVEVSVSPTLTHVRPQMTLDAILQHFQGNDAPLTNINTVNYSDQAPNANDNPFNYALKSGRVSHSIQSLQTADTSGYGDSHEKGLSALNNAIFHLLNDVLGFGISGSCGGVPRQALRLRSSWYSSPGVLDAGVLGSSFDAIACALTTEDGPNNKLPDLSDPDGDGRLKPDNLPTTLVDIDGMVESAYANLLPLRAALALGLERAQAGYVNWLRNSSFNMGDNYAFNLSHDPAQAPATDLEPLHWAIDGLGIGASNWGRLEHDVTDRGGIASITTTLFLQNQELRQRVVLGTAALRQVFEVMPAMHAALAVDVTQGEVEFGLRGFADLPAPDTKVFEVVSQPLGSADPGVGDYNLMVKFDRTSNFSENFSYFEFFVRNRTAVPAIFTAYGASAGPGVPPASATYSREHHEFLSRDGGEQSPMRGHLMLDGNDVWFGPEYDSVEWAEAYLGGGAIPTLDAPLTTSLIPATYSLRPILQELLDRSNVGAGPNLLVNEHFHQTNDGVFPDSVSCNSTFNVIGQPLFGWFFNSMGSNNWALIPDFIGDPVDGSGWGGRFAVVMPDGAIVHQVISDDDAGNPSALVGALVSCGGYLSASVVIQTDQDLVLDIIGTNDGVTNEWATSKVIPSLGNEVRAHTITVKIPIGTNVRDILLRIRNASGLDANVAFFSAALNIGMPQLLGDRSEVDHMPRSAGRRAPFRNHVYFGRNDSNLHLGRHCADPINGTDVVNLRTLENGLASLFFGDFTEFSGAVTQPDTSGIDSYTTASLAIYDPAVPYGFLLTPPIPGFNAQLEAATQAFGSTAFGSATFTLTQLVVTNVGAGDATTQLAVNFTISGGSNATPPNGSHSVAVPANNTFVEIARVTAAVSGNNTTARLECLLTWSGPVLQVQFRLRAFPVGSSGLLPGETSTLTGGIGYKAPFGDFNTSHTIS